MLRGMASPGRSCGGSGGEAGPDVMCVSHAMIVLLTYVKSPAGGKKFYVGALEGGGASRRAGPEWDRKVRTGRQVKVFGGYTRVMTRARRSTRSCTRAKAPVTHRERMRRWWAGRSGGRGEHEDADQACDPTDPDAAAWRRRHYGPDFRPIV